MMLRRCCAQSPVYTRTARACAAALIALHASESIASLAAASMTAARRRLVARAALQVSLMTSEPASRSSARSRGCGPDHAAAPSARRDLNFSTHRVSSLRPRENNLFSMAPTTCSAVPPAMTKAPRSTMFTTRPFIKSKGQHALELGHSPRCQHFPNDRHLAADLEDRVVGRLGDAKPRTDAAHSGQNVRADCARGGEACELPERKRSDYNRQCHTPLLSLNTRRVHHRYRALPRKRLCRSPLLFGGRPGRLPQLVELILLRERSNRDTLHETSRVKRLLSARARARATSRCLRNFAKASAVSFCALSCASFCPCPTILFASSRTPFIAAFPFCFKPSSFLLERTLAPSTRVLARALSFVARAVALVALKASSTFSFTSPIVAGRVEAATYFAEYSRNSDGPHRRSSCAMRTTSHTRRGEPARFDPTRFGPKKRFLLSWSMCELRELTGMKSTCHSFEPSCITQATAARTSLSLVMLSATSAWTNPRAFQAASFDGIAQASAPSWRAQASMRIEQSYACTKGICMRGKSHLHVALLLQQHGVHPKLQLCLWCSSHQEDSDK
eukprot:6211758-Pleurochrysis_carterae.AAC.1